VDDRAAEDRARDPSAGPDDEPGASEDRVLSAGALDDGAPEPCERSVGKAGSWGLSTGCF